MMGLVRQVLSHYYRPSVKTIHKTWWLKHAKKAQRMERCRVGWMNTHSFKLDSLSDLVQKRVSAHVGCWPLFLLHLFKLGSFSDLTQQRRLVSRCRQAAVPSVSFCGEWRSWGWRARGRWRGRRRRWCASAG